MIGVSLLVLILDIGHPAELRAFVFYIEVCVYVRACTNAFLPFMCMYAYLCCSPSVKISLYTYKLHAYTYVRMYMCVEL